MRYLSTRNQAPAVDFRGALLGGLAPDGGLYVPEEIPALPPAWEAWSYVEAMASVLELFGAGETHDLVAEAASRFRHPEIAPLVPVGGRVVYELFWGPTLSFKDHALQVVSLLLDQEWSAEGARGKVLVATSGDTGSAAVEACRDLTHLDLYVLFPEGRVTEFQRRQMTTVVAGNVHPIAVRGTFDDCQDMVKSALIEIRHGLFAVNSINWGRVAAQVGYYVYAGAHLGETFDVVVPTGNFGNVYSSWVAKQMGVPIDRITIANNANRMLADLVATGQRRQEAVKETVSPAMDIQVPSNLERMQGRRLDGHFRAGWASDEEIIATISAVSTEHGYLLDPHTAAAWHVGQAKQQPGITQVVVATADPAKFPDVVGEALGSAPPVPAGFSDLYERPERFVTIDAITSELEALVR